MSNKFKRAGLPTFICLTLLLSGCGGLNLWPFGGHGGAGRSGRPANATQYVCGGGKTFYVRMLDNGNAAWVIYAEREFRLDKAESKTGARYSNGVAVLEINGNQVALQDGPNISLPDCKAAVNQAPS